MTHKVQNTIDALDALAKGSIREEPISGTRFKVAWASAATVFSRVRVYSESVARAYRYKDSVNERALFVIDAEGKVYWSFVSPISVNPGADGSFLRWRICTINQQCWQGWRPND